MMNERQRADFETNLDIDLAYGVARAHNRGMVEFCSVDARLIPTLYVPLADFDQDGAGDVCDPDDDNDGLADGFDCAPLDAGQGSVGLVATLSAENAGGVAHLTWDAAARAETYDIQRGTLTELALGSYGACWAAEIAVTTYDDADVPAAGEGYFYLVRGHDAGCGEGGSLGTDSAGVPRPSACP